MTLDHFVREDVNKLKVRRALSKVIPTKPLLLILPPSLPPSIPHSIIFIPNSLPPLFSPSSSPSQYKDQVPKHPQIAYMLFSKQKGPKVKSKHPGLTSRELAVKLGEAVLKMVKGMFTVGIRLEYGGSQIAIIFVPDFLCSSSSSSSSLQQGKKWTSLAPHPQQKYKKMYLQQKMKYKTQLEEFCSIHPDARPPRVSPTRRSDHCC